MLLFMTETMSSGDFNNPTTNDATLNNPPMTPRVSGNATSSKLTSGGLRLRFRVPRSSISTRSSGRNGKVLRSGTLLSLSTTNITKKKDSKSKAKNQSRKVPVSAAFASADPNQSTVVDDTAEDEEMPPKDSFDSNDNRKVPASLPALKEADNESDSLRAGNGDDKITDEDDSGSEEESDDSGNEDDSDDEDLAQPAEEKEEVDEENKNDAEEDDEEEHDEDEAQPAENNEEENDEEKNNDDEEDDEEERVVVRRDRHIYDYSKPWQNENGRSQFLDNEIQEQLLFLAGKEFNGTIANGLSWKKEGMTKRSGESKTRQVHKCHFKNESKCPFQICVVRDTETALSTIFIGKRTHSDHTINNKKRGLSSQIIAELVRSPTSLRKKGTKSMVHQVMHQKKIRLDKAEQKKASRALYRLKGQLEKEILGGLDGRTFEGLDRKLRSYKKSLLFQEDDYDEDTFFLCGEHICDGTEGKERIAALFSTDNLLLNMYRWWCTGYDLTFSVDTSYRYMVQGYGLLPIRVVDFSQTSHVVAYGLISKEDIRAHGFLFYQLKKECEKTVAYYREIGYFD